MDMNYTQTHYMSDNKLNYINRPIAATSNKTLTSLKLFNELQSEDNHILLILTIGNVIIHTLI